tara:strand:+ start:468 stop:695 length:228 start_codon:yes stop_codon:yes gene_type:complete
LFGTGEHNQRTPLPSTGGFIVIVVVVKHPLPSSGHHQIILYMEARETQRQRIIILFWKSKKTLEALRLARLVVPT